MASDTTTRHPWWIVNAIFDPSGAGSDFSYTEGLAARGFPELHLWARPDRGLDPGADWRLSQDDTCRLLNELAWRLIDGDLQVGDVWEGSYDEGFTTARFELGAAVDAASVDAYGAGDAPVLPVRWSLEREPVGAPRDLAPTEQEEALREYIDVLWGVDSDGEAPDGWELEPEPHWHAAQAFGPRTPLVRARAAHLWGADADFWARLLHAGLNQRGFRPPGYAAAVASAAARGPGRVDALERLGEAVQDVLSGLGTTWAVEEMAALRDLFLGDDLTGQAGEVAWRNARGLLAELVHTCLAVEVVADRLPTRIRTYGQGAMMTSAVRPGEAPSADWACSAPVAAAVRRLLCTSSPDAVAGAAVAWSRRSGASVYSEVDMARITGSCHAPRVADSLDQAAHVRMLVAVVTAGEEMGVLQEWASGLSTILTERVLLSEESVAAFLEAGAAVPGLRELVNTPIVAEPDPPTTSVSPEGV